MEKAYQFLKDVSSFPYPDEGDTVLNFVPRGWRGAFLKTCARIEEAFQERGVSSIHFRFDQVKEKFGALRVYWHIDYDCADETTVAALEETCSTLIDKIESKTEDLCVECGAPATRTSTPWILPYCDKCAQQKHAESNLKHAALDKAYPPK